MGRIEKALRRFGQIGMLKEDMVEVYIKLHADPWPEVVDMIRECGLTNYSIFIQGRLVFTYYEYTGTDYEADMRKMEADPITQEWWKHTHPCFETYAFDKESPYYHDMESIFYVEQQD